MNEEAFWKIFEEVNRNSQGDMDLKCEKIKNRVAHLSRDDALEFDYIFDEMMDKAYSWKLWAAAYIINGGCSDDTFMDFRSSLISQGKDIFEKALLEPDSLADMDIDENNWCFEGIQYAVSDGVESAVGERPDRRKAHPDTPSGNSWQEDELGALLPKLDAKYS